MTSDTVSMSDARVQLNFALGKTRISLGALTAGEFDELLREILSGIDLRELRGFQPLGSLLSRSPGSWITGARQDPTEVVKVSLKVGVFFKGPVDKKCDLKTHFMSAHRGTVGTEITWKRYEVDQETTDREVAYSWGNSAYVHRVKESLLLIRRPNDHTKADDNLFRVTSFQQKVPHEDEMSVHQIEIEYIPLLNFRETFGNRYPSVTQYLIWELRDLSYRTAETLKGQMERFQQQLSILERLSGSIME